MTPERASKDGLVLSGGGAKGAYEVGIMKALAEGRSPATGFQPLEVEHFTGTSVGAYNAAFLVAQTDLPLLAAVDRLGKIWRERIGGSLLSCGNGVFRLRDGPLKALDPGCWRHPLEILADTAKDTAFWTRYFAVRGSQFLKSSQEPLEGRILDALNMASAVDPTPLYQLIGDTVDRAGLSASHKTLTIAATDWLNGTVKHFSKADLAGPVGPQGIAASTAIPGIFPPVPIDGVPYHDGGVLENTPLKPVIVDGAEVVHTIFLDPETIDIPLSVPANTIDTVYRFFLITSSALLRADIANAKAIQRELELHVDLGILSQDFREVLTERGLREANSRVLRRLAEGRRRYRSLTVHIYRPKTDLGGGAGLLDFSTDFITELIKTGYEDALDHDCKLAGCLIPATEAEPS